jgi:hypothetical protein
MSAPRSAISFMEMAGPPEIAVMLDRTRHVVAPRHHTMHVPRTMFAAAIDRFGGPEVLTPHALPVPAVDAGEVLIAVDTAGVGRWDADVREGFFAGRKPSANNGPWGLWNAIAS